MSANIGLANIILLFVVIATFVVSATQTVQIVLLENEVKSVSSEVQGISAPARQGPRNVAPAPTMVGGC